MRTSCQLPALLSQVQDGHRPWSKACLVLVMENGESMELGTCTRDRAPGSQQVLHHLPAMSFGFVCDGD